MKYLIYMSLIFICGLLFLPQSGSEQIRNVPLLLIIVLFVFTIFIIKILKYILLMYKTNRVLKEIGFKCIKFFVFPLCSTPRMIFEKGNEKLNIILLVRKKKHIHYFFKDPNHIEFYKSNRIILNNIKAYGATVSKLVETKLIGKQTIRWNHHFVDSNNICILLFDKLPANVTDSVKTQGLGNGDRICNSNINLYDFGGLQKSYSIIKH